MRSDNAKNRSPKNRESSDISDVKGNSGIMGATATISVESGNDQIRTGTKDSKQRDTVSSRKWSSNGVTGKIIGQLIGETERQLAYHKTQVNELETRLQELHQLAEESHLERNSE
ncbi:MAG: hypothetical protein KME23_08050 [Goleter apudmare HA4340-LM2]|jgi:hypothetical protein|nr:hypothetical protein [Goleter apudmare HA4340-LM2]